MNTATAVGTRSRATKTVTASPLPVSDTTIERLTNVFNMLADRSRLKILLALAREGELHVTALCELLRQSQPAVSHHLTLLRMNGLVSYRRDGKHNFYHLDSTLIRDLFEQFFSDSGNGQRQLQFEDFLIAYKRK